MNNRSRMLKPLYLFLAVLSVGFALYAYNDKWTLKASEITEGPRIGAFELSTLDGKRFSNENITNRPLVVFFGFTSCPEVCPTTLAELTSLLEDMGEASNELVPIFISVDPERDTAPVLRQYMGSFDGRILALRGTVDQTRLAAKAFSAAFKKVPLEDGDYTMDHSAGVRLIRSDGTLQGTLDMHEPREIQLKKLVMLAHTATTHLSRASAGRHSGVQL